MTDTQPPSPPPLILVRCRRAPPPIVGAVLRPLVVTPAGLAEFPPVKITDRELRHAATHPDLPAPPLYIFLVRPEVDGTAVAAYLEGLGENPGRVVDPGGYVAGVPGIVALIPWAQAFVDAFNAGMQARIAVEVATPGDA